MPNFRAFWEAGKSWRARRAAGNSYEQNSRYTNRWFRLLGDYSAADEFIDLNPPSTSSDFWISFYLNNDFSGGSDGWMLFFYDEDENRVLYIDLLDGAIIPTLEGPGGSTSVSLGGYGNFRIPSQADDDENHPRLDLKFSWSGGNMTVDVYPAASDANFTATIASTWKHPKRLVLAAADAGGGTMLSMVITSEHDTRPYNIIKSANNGTKGAFKGMKNLAKKISETDSMANDFGSSKSAGEKASVGHAGIIAYPSDENIYGFAVGGHVRSPDATTLRYNHILEKGASTVYEGATKSAPSVAGLDSFTIWQTNPETGLKWANKTEIDAFNIGVGIKESA